MHTVSAVVLEGQNPLEFTIACEVFGLGRPEVGLPWYRFFLCAADPPPLHIAPGFVLDTEHGLERLAEADTVIVPGWCSLDREPPEGLLDALRAAYRRGARMVSFCTGAFALAAAGILDGRPATTHWATADRLAALYPSVRVDPRVLYVDDGQVLTSAGAASALDLALHIVRLDHGAEVANAVARQLVVPPHRDGGQAQYVEMPVPPSPGPDPLGATLAWALDHLAEPISVEDLAARALQSPRTFARHFRATVGTTPHQWLVRQRVLYAQRLLETTEDAVELVAQRSGFGSAATLRAHFQRIVSTAPLAYRRVFRHATAA